MRYDIPVTPDLEPGNPGWCSEPRFSIKGAASVIGGETCSPAYQPGAPALLAGGEPISNASELFTEARQPLNERQGQMILFWMVVSPRVAAVRLRGEVVASRADPRLPAGWRAVVAFISGPGAIQPVPLDRSGRPITEPETIPGRTTPGSGPLTAVRSYHPGGAAPSPCSIHGARLPMVTGQWEVIATTAPALGSAVGRNVLFSCARSWFSVKGQSQAASAAVLLGTRDPRRPAPPLPGLRPTAQPGVYSEDGGASGQILAKRVGHAWLVVQGQSVLLTKALLNTLRVKGQSVQ